MAAEENTNWGKAVAGIVIKDSRVLLVRHTYGRGKGKLIIPGGYVESNETPEEAVCREIMEETGVLVKPQGIVGIRFNYIDWYVVFLTQYIEGTARSDGNENSEAIWVPVDEAVHREDVPDLTKKLIESVMQGKNEPLMNIPYEGSLHRGPYSLYGLL